MTKRLPKVPYPDNLRGPADLEEIYEINRAAANCLAAYGCAMEAWRLAKSDLDNYNRGRYVVELAKGIVRLQAECPHTWANGPSARDKNQQCLICGQLEVLL